MRLVVVGLAASAFLLGRLAGGRSVVVGLAVVVLLGALAHRLIERSHADALQADREVSDRRLEEVRQDRSQVERLLDALPTSVLLFDEDGVAYANPAARTQFDMPDPLGMSPLRALGVTALVEAVEESEATGRDVMITASRDGRELLARVAPTGGNDTALIVTDLTDLRRVEEMRRDFVANASHELKTPVTGIWALADSLELALDQDPERARAMISRIQLEAMRMSQLVRDLLDLTRLEEGMDGRGRERVELMALCRHQINRLGSIAATASVTLELAEGPDASIIGIRDDLTLIIGNLIQNAIQYNQPSGTVTIAVAREGGRATITVSDDGIGIPEADQDRIFERFYRVDKARSRAAGGTGLGLSLIRHAVERHGGRISVQSVLGEGSDFTVTLPVDGQATR